MSTETKKYEVVNGVKELLDGSGAQLVVSKPTTPVMVTFVREVGTDGETFQLTLEQMHERRLSASSTVGELMKGHPSFQNNGASKRVAWVNVSKHMILELGILKQAGDFTAVHNAPKRTLKLGVPVPFMFRDGNVKLIEKDTFVARTWVDKQTGDTVTQPAKSAGQGGDILKRDGKAIYRNNELSYPGLGDVAIGREWDEDYFIPHNNNIKGSTITNREIQASVFQPAIRPALEQQERSGDNSQSLTPFQNDQIAAGKLDLINNADPNNPQLNRTTQFVEPDQTSESFAGKAEELAAVEAEMQNAGGEEA